jgi:ferredoxin
VRVVTCYSQPHATDRAGIDFNHESRLRADMLDPSLITRRARFYICGPEGMDADISAALKARGVPPFEIFHERFVSPRPIAVPSGGSRHRIRFERSGVVLDWASENGSILDLAEKNGVTIPTGCRVGQCESCRVHVIDGEAAHAALPGELDDGSCLTCQAVPLSNMTLDA